MTARMTPTLLLAAFFVAAAASVIGPARAMPAAPPVRAVHVVLNSLAVSDLARQADMAARAGFNTMILDLGNKVAFRSFPGQLSPTAWSPDEFLAAVGYIRGKGMEVIPGVPLLSHQWQFLAGTHPELILGSGDYNPENTAVYKLVFPYLDEIISTLRPRAIHIGHDEVEGELPADSFLRDVNLIHDHLKQKGVETWMWGDMLISRDEFQSMFPGPLSGNLPGYGRRLRARLPKDIVICDWHYRDTQADFPSLAAFKAEGFRVLGATWRNSQTTRNFSRYAAAHGAEGMIVTTWFDPNDPKVVHSWDELGQIIQEAGKDFFNDFK